MNDIVIRAIELASKCTPVGLDVQSNIVVVQWNTQNACTSLALDIGLPLRPRTQDVDGVIRRQRTHDVAHLHTRTGRSGYGTKAAYQNARHGSRLAEIGNLA